MARKLVVVGGTAAGMSAAAKTRRINPHLIIKVYTDDKDIAYGSCGLPNFLGGYVKEVDNLVVRRREEFERDGIQVHYSCRALELFPEKGKLGICNLKDGTMNWEYYDQLVLATLIQHRIPVA